MRGLSLDDTISLQGGNATWEAMPRPFACVVHDRSKRNIQANNTPARALPVDCRRCMVARADTIAQSWMNRALASGREDSRKSSSDVCVCLI